MSLQYKAFISYSHSDESWARWLHRALERYRIPKRLVAELGLASNRLAPVFRDRDELRASSSLSDGIESALERAESLIVICSPGAAQSHWVNEEVRFFRSLGRDQIHCLIVDGEPPEAFPPAILETGEPLAADPRESGDARRGALLKIVAAMLDVSFDKLRQRESAVRQRRLAAIAAAAVFGMLLTGTLATLAVLGQRQAELARAQALDALAEAQAQRQRAETEAQTTKRVSEFLIGLFRSTDPNEAEGKIPSTLEIVDRGVERIHEELADEPEVRAALLDMLANVYTNLGFIEKALPLHESLVEYAQTNGDVNAIAQAHNDLGEALAFQGEYEDALAHLNRALEQLEIEDDENMRGIVYNNISEVLFQLGDNEGSKAQLQKSIAIADKRGDVAQLFVRLNALGELQAGDGEFAEAKRTFERNLAAVEGEFGENHIYAADALNNLAYVNQKLGMDDLALTQLERSIALTEAQYDFESPKLAASLINLAQIKRRKGELRAALPLLIRAVEIFRSTTPRDYPIALTILAGLLIDLGDGAEAKSNYETALELLREGLGDDHALTGRALVGIGRSYALLDEVDAADRYMREGMDVVERAVGSDHPTLADALVSSAPQLERIGNVERARAWIERAIEIYAARLGPDHRSLVEARAQLAALEPEY